MAFSSRDIFEEYAETIGSRTRAAGDKIIPRTEELRWDGFHIELSPDAERTYKRQWANSNRDVLNARQRARYRNPECRAKILDDKKRSRLKHIDRVKAYRRAYKRREDVKAKAREQAVLYYWKHRQQILEKVKRNRERMRIQQLAWRAKNREKMRLYHRDWRAKRKSA